MQGGPRTCSLATRTPPRDSAGLRATVAVGVSIEIDTGPKIKQLIRKSGYEFLLVTTFTPGIDWSLLIFCPEMKNEWFFLIPNIF